jgi:hypothetical protein
MNSKPLPRITTLATLVAAVASTLVLSSPFRKFAYVFFRLPA